MPPVMPSVMPSVTTRFAPSPNGQLHLGHAYAAIVAHDRARAEGGAFRLRIEDIDGVRSRSALAEEFLADLAWLGLAWDGPVVRQSSRLAQYALAAERLRALGVLYPCRCTRGQVLAQATMAGPDGPLYPGTCRGREVDPAGAQWRLDIGAALALTGPLAWDDALAGTQRAAPEVLGDVVLVRRDAPASYHLAAMLDDAADGITLVTRGADLFAATHIHRLLQALLGLPLPRWHHHALLRDASGAKLAKRRGSAAHFGLATRRRAGESGTALADALRGGHFPPGISLGGA